MEWSKIPIAYIATVHLMFSLFLFDALYVPTFKFNLISASKLVRQSNCFSSFNLNFCLIQDLKCWKWLDLLGKRNAYTFYTWNTIITTHFLQLQILVIFHLLLTLKFGIIDLLIFLLQRLNSYISWIPYSFRFLEDL